MTKSKVHVVSRIVAHSDQIMEKEILIISDKDKAIEYFNGFVENEIVELYNQYGISSDYKIDEYYDLLKDHVDFGTIIDNVLFSYITSCGTKEVEIELTEQDVL